MALVTGVTKKTIQNHTADIKSMALVTGVTDKKFWLSFFKSSRSQEAEPLVALRRVRNSFIFPKRRKVFKKTLAGGFLKCEAQNKRIF